MFRGGNTLYLRIGTDVGDAISSTTTHLVEFAKESSKFYWLVHFVIDAITNAMMIDFQFRQVYARAVVKFWSPLEGYGGIPYGDENDQIALSTCTPVATADEIDPESLMSPVWGKKWTLPEANEILIGPKQDDFCFIVFPGDDSVGTDATLKWVQSNCSIASLNILSSFCTVTGRGREAHSRNPSRSLATSFGDIWITVDSLNMLWIDFV